MTPFDRIIPPHRPLITYRQQHTHYDNIANIYFSLPIHTRGGSPCPFPLSYSRESKRGWAAEKFLVLYGPAWV